MSTHSNAPLIEGFALGPYATNCYLVREPSQHECWIIDAGLDPQPIIDRVRELDLSVGAILLTHAHHDHIWGLADLKAAFPDAPVLIHASEMDFPADPRLNLSAAAGAPIAAPRPDKALEAGETLTLGDSRWKVLHTPGHSPGGVAFWCDAAEAVISGDTLFAGSIGRTDLPTSDTAALERSIREQLYALPDATHVYPGHGPATTIGVEKKHNPYVRAV